MRAMVIAANVTIAATLLGGQASLAQGRPRFDVVSVRRCDPNARPATPPPGAARGGASRTSPERFRVDCRRVVELILDAYVRFADGRYTPGNLRPTFDMQNAGPDWIRSEQFTIEATAEHATPFPLMQGPMLQAVLEDRFKLKVHRETRQVPIYELVVAPGGAKVTPFKTGSCVEVDRRCRPRSNRVNIVARRAPR